MCSTLEVSRRRGRSPLRATSQPTSNAASTPSAPKTNSTPPSFSSVRSLGANGWARISAAPLLACTVATRNRSPSSVTRVRTTDSRWPVATSYSGRPSVKSGTSSPVTVRPSAVTKMIRTSAAPSIQAGAPSAVISDSVVKAVALCARLSSDWSSELIICWRITTKAVNAMTAIERPSATVVSTATRDARDLR